MVLEILCLEPIYPQYSGILETCLALRYWFFEVLGSESVNVLKDLFFACGALAASICVGIVTPSSWLSIYITYCLHNGRVKGEQDSSPARVILNV